MTPTRATRRRHGFAVALVVLAGAAWCSVHLDATAAPGREPVTLAEGTVVRLATAKQGDGVLRTVDTFVATMSPFDRCVRVGVAKDPGRAGYLDFAAAQVRDWTDEEAASLRTALEAVAKKIAPLDLPLPAEILLIKTTGREEADAAYTRGTSIVLPQAMASPPDEGLLLHELFHVISRHDAALRDALYEVVGFHRCGEVPLPDALRPRAITNPDAPEHAHRITLRRGDDVVVDAVPVLYSASDFDPDSGLGLFHLLQFRLMVVEKAPGGDWHAKLEKAGQAGKSGEAGGAGKPGEPDKADKADKADEAGPVLLEPGETPDYARQVGRNTGYVIHPEEILADNFVMLAEGRTKLPSPEIPAAMAKALSRLAAERRK